MLRARSTAANREEQLHGPSHIVYLGVVKIANDRQQAGFCGPQSGPARPMRARLQERSYVGPKSLGQLLHELRRGSLDSSALQPANGPVGNTRLFGKLRLCEPSLDT